MVYFSGFGVGMVILHFWVRVSEGSHFCVFGVRVGCFLVLLVFLCLLGGFGLVVEFAWMTWLWLSGVLHF